MTWSKWLVATGACLAAAAPLNSTNFLQKRNTGTCNSDQFVGVQQSGAPSLGTPFCESGFGTNFVPISGIETWSNDIYIDGMQFHYADGSSSPVYGSQAGSVHQAIFVDYSSGQRWKSFDMYSHTDPNTLNTIDIFTTNGQELYAGAQQATFAGQAVHTNQPVGSGILFGALGSSDGTSLRDLGLLLLASPIASIQIDNIQYPDGPNGADGISVDSIAEGHYFNELDSGDVTYNFQDSKAVTNTQTFTQTTATMFGSSETIKFDLTIKIIDIVSADVGSSTEFSWSTTFTQSVTNTITTQETVTWSAMGMLAPHMGVNTAAIVGTSQGSFPYTSTVTIILQNGYQFTYPENGFITVNDVSQAVVLVTENDNP